MSTSFSISASGLTLIQSFEGFYARPYRCPAGVLTQGYGHTAAAGTPALGGVWSKEYASDVLSQTIEHRYAAPMRKLLTREANQSQFDAMVSLAYNIGISAFSHSSVLRCFNKGDDKGAVSAFADWNKSKGRVLKGLVRRRACEALLYQNVKNIDFNDHTYGKMPQRVDRPPEADSKETHLIRYLQQRLRELGYHELGEVDGVFGSRTRGALLAFKADHDLPLNGEIDDATLRALASVSRRKISQDRELITEQELRDRGSSTIIASDRGKAASIATGITGFGAMVLQIVSELGTARDRLSPLLDLGLSFAPWFAGIAVIVFASLSWWSAHKTAIARLNATREGRHA